MGIFSPDGALARLLNTLGNLIVLNILTIICCVPVFTAGAAMTALYTMVMRMVRKEDGKIISEYLFPAPAVKTNPGMTAISIRATSWAANR